MPQVHLDEQSVFMQQNPILFDQTVHKNITIGLEDSDKVPHDEAAVKDVCITAQLNHELPVPRRRRSNRGCSQRRCLR